MASPASTSAPPGTPVAPPAGERTAYALGLVLIAITSVQCGAALAVGLFDDLGVGGTVFLRVAVAAVLLAVLWRPAVRGHSRADWRTVLLFGVALAAMNWSFYAALDRIPLGLAVTCEFVGPLGVAVAGSRRALDGLWVVLAAAGILAIAGPGGSGLDPAGVGLALLAGVFWASYIVLSVRTGRAFAGGSGLAIAMVVASVALVPVGVVEGGADLLAPGALAVGAGVALLSSAIPYSAELEALRHLPQHVFGILLSLEPAAAALAGYVILEETLSSRELAGILLVVIASAGALRRAPAPPEP